MLALMAPLGLAVFGAVPARAQEHGAAAARGITVIGYGEARAPAESATLQFVVTRDDYGPPRAPRVGATPGVEERELVAPTVDALRAAGIAGGRRVLVPGNHGDRARDSRLACTR